MRRRILLVRMFLIILCTLFPGSHSVSGEIFIPASMASSSLKGGRLNSLGDNGQLTIRIPNPKVYMARQSLWIGHRGKPRCDHCRVNNLKVC